MNGKLAELNEIIQDLMEFLEPFKPLANTHNVQFLADNLWMNESLIHRGIRIDLDNYLLNECASENKQQPNLVKFYTSLKERRKNESDLNTIENFFLKLHEFNKIWDSRVLTTSETLLSNENRKDLIEFNEKVNKKFEVMVKQNRFMNEKKSYEVDEMSKFVSKLCKKLDVYTVEIFFLFWA
jgi:hypothetical protein